MISYDLGMHHAGVLLCLFMLVLLLLLSLVLVIQVLRDPRMSHGQHKCAREYG